MKYLKNYILVKYELIIFLVVVILLLLPYNYINSKKIIISTEIFLSYVFSNNVCSNINFISSERIIPNDVLTYIISENGFTITHDLVDNYNNNFLYQKNKNKIDINYGNSIKVFYKTNLEKIDNVFLSLNQTIKNIRTIENLIWENKYKGINMYCSFGENKKHVSLKYFNMSIDNNEYKIRITKTHSKSKLFLHSLFIIFVIYFLLVFVKFMLKSDNLK